MRNSNLRRLLYFGVTCAMLLVMSLSFVNAQSTANYTFTTNTTGSLGLDMNGNIVDMSSGTTQVLTTNTSQDQSINAAAIPFPAGFEFFVGGNRFTSYFATSNGIVQLGNAAVIGGGTYTAGGGTLAAPRFSAFNGDLGTGTTGGIFGKLIGSAPNRCYVIEFRNMTQMWTTAYTNDGTYQVRFYENTGVVEYVYGTMFCTSTTSASDATPEAGFSWGTTLNQSISVNFLTSATNLSGTMTQNVIPAATPIGGINSATEGSRRVYRFTPPVPSAPSGLTFSNVLTGSMGLNWTDNASNEVAYALYNSTDGINYTFYGTVPANTTATTTTGLLANTLYFWRVIAVSEGALSSPALSGSQSTLPAAPIGGVKTVGVGGDYSNLTIAFAEINANTLSANIDLQLITGYPAIPETYPIQSSNTASVGAFNVKVYPTVPGLSITSNNTTGTLNLNNARNITFDGRVNQIGANNLVIANTNLGASYAILLNNDASNNTIQNCIVHSTNNSTTSGTIVFGTTTGANGNDNNTITACDIRDGASTPNNGIYSVGTTTTAAQFNDNNTVTDNNISNFFNAGSATVGVFLGAGNSTWTISNNKLFQTATRTYTTGNTHNGIQVNNTTGNGFVINGNTIGFASAGGTGTYTMAGTVATRFIGINISSGTTTASSIQGNTITNISLATSSGAATGNGIFAGINITGGNVNVGNVTPNIIGATTGTGAISATTSTAGGLVVGINSSSAGNVTISGNNIGSINAAGSTLTSPASIAGIQVSGGTPIINNNIIGSTTTANSINAITGATSGAQIVNGINVTSGVTLPISIQSNTIANLTQTGTTTAGIIRGITYAGTGVATISLNNVSILTGSNANTTVAGAGTGIQGILHTGTATGGGTISDNTIHTLIGANANTVQTNVNGIGIANLTAPVVRNNRVYNLQNASTGVTATTPPTASGILIRGVGAVTNISNNMISLGNAQTTNTEFIGIWNNFTSVGAINIYHNSVNIEGAATAGALPSYAFLRGDNTATAVTSTVDIRNNIFNNTRSGGTGKHYAIANQSTVPSATGWGFNASNFNLLNTIDPATVGLWGSTDANFNAWRIAASSDANSFTAQPVVFVNTAAGDLHLNMGVTATPIESGGTTIAAVTTDIDSQTRPGPAGSVNGGGTSPDLGADEIDAVPALPVITINSVTPPASTQCTTADRLVSANITTPVGTIVSANLVYTINGTPQAPIAMTNVSGTTWTGTIPASVPVNATIVWAISATNSSGLSASASGTTYTDEPLLGQTASAAASATVVCAGSPSNLSAQITSTGSVQLGTGTTTTNVAGITPFNSNWEGSRTQYLIRASELQALGLVAGNITSMRLIVTATGAGTFQQVNYTIKMAHTANTVLASAYGTPIGSFTTVFTTPSEPAPAVGPRNYTFSTPFNWDGVSNVLVDICHDNDITNSCASCFSSNSSVQFSVTPFNSVWGSYADNVVSCGVQATNTISVFNNRPNMIFTGTVGTPITSVSWMDGMTAVGTGNPLTVNPTTTTTYTANITALGCTFSPAPTATVTVNPLPSAPTATNSAQCGTQIPTASVASTSGLPTPTFNWYAAASGGVALQSSTSTIYTSNVSTTTTFYVSELNAVTGCESARTAVTVTVATADGISASASATSICIGSSVTLTAANTNPTPNQSYSYTWSSVANSGANPSVNGASVTVTPTQPGTYQYDLSGVDGGCNAVANVSVTVNPFTATVTPINITCNGYNNGSFSLSGSSCGTLPYSYSVDGGTFGAIPTNLTPGAHTVVVRDANNYLATLQNITITEPSTTIATPSGTGATVCQNGTSAQVSATSNTNAPTPQTTVVNFALAAQPTEVQTAPGVIISTATVPSLPAGAVITGLTLASNGLIPNGGEYQTDVKLGLSGIFTNAAAQGTGLTGFGTVAGVPYNYTRAIPVAGFPTTGGSLNVVYWNDFNDIVGGPDATFPLGASAITLTINYTVPTPATISWWDAPTAGTQIGTGSPFETVGTSVLPNTSTPGTYTVYAQGDFGGCNTITRTAVTVTVNALPAVNAGTDQVVCSGTQVTLSGSGATSYSWNNSVTNATAFTPSATTTYTVTGTDANGCQNTDQVLVTVNALPTVNAGSDVAVCTGTAATLTASGTATGYSWDNGVTDGVAFTPASTTTYTVTGTDGNGCQNTDAVVVTVNALPTVNAGTDQSACIGSTVTLSGSGATSYSWDNGVTDGVAFNATTTTTYNVTGTDANGCQNTDAVTVTVNALPTVNAGADQTVCSGVSITLSGSGATSYSWDNGVTDGVAFNATTTTTYNVTGTDANGCQNTDAVTVTVNAAPSVNAGADIALCFGDSITLSASGTATSYTWDNGVIDNVEFAPTTTTTYTVTGTDASGCSATDALTVTVNALPAVNAGSDQTVCSGASVTLSGSGATSYSWDNGVTDGVAFNATTTTTYFVLGTDANGCSNTDDVTVTVNALPTVSANATATTICAGDAVTLTGSGATSYSWNNGVTDGVAITPSATTTYTVTGTDASGCTNTDDVTITVNAVPTATATDNGDATITASSGSSYQWINCTTNQPIAGATSQTYTATANGDYAVIVTNGSGCSDTSACVNIDYIGLTEMTDASIRVFPNPTNSDVFVTMTAAEATVEVRDAQGKLLQATTVLNGEKVGLGAYETGVYFLTIRTENGATLERIVKQ